MPQVNGATLLARALAAAGSGPVCTLSGHQILPVYDAGIDAGLRFVDTRHEAAAVHLADGWGRLTGRPGVALVTAAPGHANALTAVATAQASESPILLLSGGTDVADIGRGGFQEMDQLTMIRPVCKAAWMPRTAAELPALVALALRTAAEGVPGPVHITVPYDVLHQQIDDASVPIPTGADYLPAIRAADDADVEQAVARLAEARRPMLLASPSLWRGRARAHLDALRDLTGLVSLPIDSAVGLAEPSLHGLGRALQVADLVVLAAPQDFAMGFADEATVPVGIPILQIAADRATIGKNRAVDRGIVATPGAVLGQVLGAARRRTWPPSDWPAEIDAMRAAQRARTRALEDADDAPIHPMRVMAAVRDQLRPDDCLALDGGDFVRWARWVFGGGPWELLTNGKLGALGPGIPLAMSAPLARPGARSVAFVGDGTAGFHLMELDTAVRHDLPFVLIVGNDAGWATERHRQREVYGPDRLVAADLLPTRYDLVAAGLGAHAELVEQPDAVGPALARAFASGRPACLNIRVASVRAPTAV